MQNVVRLLPHNLELQLPLIYFSRNLLALMILTIEFRKKYHFLLKLKFQFYGIGCQEYILRFLNPLSLK